MVKSFILALAVVCGLVAFAFSSGGANKAFATDNGNTKCKTVGNNSPNYCDNHSQVKTETSDSFKDNKATLELSKKNELNVNVKSRDATPKSSEAPRAPKTTRDKSKPDKK